MRSDLGTRMVRLRVLKKEQEDDARILAERRKRQEERLAATGEVLKPPCFIRRILGAV